MISNFDNCLFVHIPKVAGQSIESVFLERAGLTWQQRQQMLLKHNDNPKYGPPRLAHLTALEYVELGYLSQSEFDKMYSFAFVRNPWDRLVSEYLYRQYRCSFNDFLFKFFPIKSNDDYAIGKDLYRHVIPQVEFLCDNKGKLLVDFVGKFENISEDFAKVTTKITGKSLSLPHRNKSSEHKIKKLLSFSKRKKQHYSEYYNKESRVFVADLYRQDIELFAYEFEHIKF
ncbi:MAG: sulfotransferase family protein [Colwellia sp.]|nr:sulfotransferase family protein [Colwellia sp.]